MGRGPTWSEPEKSAMVEYMDKGLDDFQISAKFHTKTKDEVPGFHKRSPDAVKRRRQDIEKQNPQQVLIDTPKPDNHHKPWTPDEDRVLLHLNALGVTTRDMSLEFKRTESAIVNRLRILEEKKSGFEEVVVWLANIGSQLHDFFFGSFKPGGRP